MKRKQEHESEDGGSDKEDNEKDQSDNEDRDGDDGSDKEEELIDVDFDFFDPKEIDFHGLKSLFKQTVANDADLFDLSGISDLIIARPHLGSVVKVDDSQDPYAVTTVLNFVAETNKKLPEPIATLKSYILSKSKKYNKENHDLFESILDSKSSGLLVNERLINMPPQIVVPMLKMLDEELEWSVEEKKEKPFEYLVYISKTYQEVEPVVNEDDDADAEGSGSKKKKKKASSSSKKVLLNFHVEDEVFEKHADFHFDFQFTNQTDQAELQQTAGIKTSRRIYVIKRQKLQAIHSAMKELLN